MKMSLMEVMKKAVKEYPTIPRKDWVVKWPGQVVLAASQIHWTSEVTQVSLVNESTGLPVGMLSYTMSCNSVTEGLYRFI